jgi:hypothetical protein
MIALFLIATAVSVTLYLDNRSLRSKNTTSSERQPMSMPICEALLTDLESADPARMDLWKRYLRHVLGNYTNLNTNVEETDFDTVCTQYQLLESPAKSNYFGRLAQSLAFLATKGSLSETSVIRYLGTPDKSAKSQTDDEFVYNFHSDGQACFAVVLITNGMVRTVGFNKK